MRIDKYLNVTRLIKRRPVANDACDGERISINGKIVKPSKEVKIGDIVEISFGNRVLKIRVLGLNEKVKKEDASTLYEVI